MFASFVRRLLGFVERVPAVPRRRERRLAAKRRHRETGEDLWTADDHAPRPPATRIVEDVAPGTPGHFGSVRSVDDQ